MAYYRIYHLDETGHIAKATERECASDEEACLAASGVLAAGQSGDVWQLGRFVRRVVGVRDCGQARPESPRISERVEALGRP